ncbi:MAG: galactitol-1-phosphate 5-dehydrogenase [Acidobacteriaceae bacterium]
MQALVLEQPQTLHLRDLPQPEVGPHDILVEVKACGICGSDVHGYDGSSGRRIPPIIMGHEASGTVAGTGSEVQRFQLGNRVTFDSTISCGNCRFCLAGQINLCEDRQVLGVSCNEYRRHGAFAEFVVVPERIVYALPEKFPFENAALIEAVSIAVHAAKISTIVRGSSAVVVGAGMIGLLAIQALRYFGCSKIFAVDIDPNRLELARRLGADGIVQGNCPELVGELRRLSGGYGFDMAVEAVGAQASILTAIESVRRGGTVTLIGNLAPKVEIPLQVVVTRQLRLLGSCASAGEYPECIALMSNGTIQVAPLISTVAPLSEGAEWFNRLYAKEPGLMKVILRP